MYIICTAFTSYKEGCKVSPTWSHLNHLVLSLKQGVGVGLLHVRYSQWKTQKVFWISGSRWESRKSPGTQRKYETKRGQNISLQKCTCRTTPKLCKQTHWHRPGSNNYIVEDAKMMKNIHMTIFEANPPCTFHIQYLKQGNQIKYPKNRHESNMWP